MLRHLRSLFSWAASLELGSPAYFIHRTTGVFNRLVNLSENIIIIGWMLFNFFVVFHTCLESKTLILAVNALSNDWKTLAFLTAPLFYRPVRKVVDEIKEFGGIKRDLIPEQAIPKTSLDAPSGAYGKEEVPQKK